MELASKHKLSDLYNLKYNEQRQFSTLELAEKLKIDPFDCLRDEIELEKLLHSQLGVVDKETLATLCPNCLRSYIIENGQPVTVLREEDGEKYCINCGLASSRSFSNELDEPSQPTVPTLETEDALEENLPFGESWGRPTCSSTVGKSLGDTLPRTTSKGDFDKYDNNLQHLLKDNCHVRTCSLNELRRENPKIARQLASSNYEPVAVETEDGPVLRMAGPPVVFDKEHAYRLRWDVKGLELVDRLPITDFQAATNAAFDTLIMRAQKVRSTVGQEDKTLDRMLFIVSDLEKRFHISFDKDKKFGNSAGANVRRAYKLCETYEIKISAKALVETMFYLTLEQFKKTNVLLQAKDKLTVDENFLLLIWQADDLIDRLMMKNGFAVIA